MLVTRTFSAMTSMLLLGVTTAACDLDGGARFALGLGATAAEGLEDDDPPLYEGEIDLAYADLLVSCYVDVPAGDPEGEGTWEFTIFFEGWATDMWVEMTDLATDYCEGWDDVTGEPCESDGVERPGWDMVQDDFGWDAARGFWDQWILDLPYHADLWPPEADASWLPCEIGVDLTLDICGCDYATDNCFCTTYDEWEYTGDDDGGGDDLFDACACRVDGGSPAAAVCSLCLLGLVALLRRR